MGIIELVGIKKSGNQISYSFSVTDDLRGYFSDKPFVIEYPENIEAVPDAIAAIPFVCNVLPIVWLTDSVLRIKELDKAFYECIPNVRNGFETMFPESTFAGRIDVGKIFTCEIPGNGSSAAFFSGGLDAVNTLVNHLEEKPALISIWGSDIRFDNADGWEVVHSGIAEYAEKYSLPDVVIHSSFREFDDERSLDKKFRQQLKDGWWHGVKHGIGLLGHAAPYAYLHRISTVYIASSNCPADGLVRCSSNPLTDNHVRFANAKVVHDGFEYSRQDKVRNVADYVNRTSDKLSLHVCWESQSGSNCCRCEKCYRTMVGLVAEDADPVDYGFADTRMAMKNFQKHLVNRHRNDVVLQKHWTHIQKRIIENRRSLKKHPDWKDIKWMLKADFWHPETLTVPVSMRGKLSQYKFYQFLHRVKVKIRG